MTDNGTGERLSLTRREREIARAYADGGTYQRIAKQLGTAPSTVRTHLATIYRKLGVSSKLALLKVLEGQGAASDAQIGAQTDPQTDMAALVSELALSLEESISRERALGEVLAIISRSNGETGEVIAAVLGYALELCDAEFGILFEYDGKQGFSARYFSGIPQPFADWFAERGAFHPVPETAIGRMASTREVVSIADIRAEALYRTGDPLREATAELGGARSFTAIPMLAGDRLIGAFTIYRKTVRPFGSRSLEIARMFADQSVIAIENARLLGEARSRSDDRNAP